MTIDDLIKTIEDPDGRREILSLVKAALVGLCMLGIAIGLIIWLEMKSSRRAVIMCIIYTVVGCYFLVTHAVRIVKSTSAKVRMQDDRKTATQGNENTQMALKKQSENKERDAAKIPLSILSLVRTNFVTLGCLVIVAGLSIWFMGGSRAETMYIFFLGGVCCLIGVLAGRMQAKSASKVEEYKKTLEERMRDDTEAVLKKQSENKDRGDAKIPLSIGFANLSGKDLQPLVAEDVATLSPLFAHPKIAADQQIPGAEILFVYAYLNEDGTIKDLAPAGIRQIAELTKATIVILASPNSPASIQKAATLPGPKVSNIVFTVDRNGSGFGQFFKELFEKMRDGKEMLSAWVELAPQHERAMPSYAPVTMLVADAGKIAFPPISPKGEK